MRRHFPQENPALISPVDGESEEKPVLAKEAREVKEEDVGESGTLKVAAPLPRLIYHRSVYLSIHREFVAVSQVFFCLPTACLGKSPSSLLPLLMFCCC
jgi:hypothetical protein